MHCLIGWGQQFLSSTDIALSSKQQLPKRLMVNETVQQKCNSDVVSKIKMSAIKYAYFAIQKRIELQEINIHLLIAISSFYFICLFIHVFDFV
jgi:predicted membrane GTPase involved in stress response